MQTLTRGVFGFAFSMLFITAFLTVPTHVSATFPGANGQITFTKIGGGRNVHTMNVDGSNLVILTNNNTSDINDEPAWSPDGTKIAYVSCSAFFDGQSCGTYIMNADGGNQTKITNNAYEPAWSPDGTKIAFMRSLGNDLEIYTMNVDGSNQTRITNNNTPDLFPAWSPDGSKIAFVSGAQIYTMSTDGSNKTKLTDGVGYEPTWSPDGSKIAFRGCGDDNNCGAYAMNDIYTMDADGNNQVKITDTDMWCGEPAWSPDGAKIAFICSDNSGPTVIYLINPDGSNLIPITDNSSESYWPDWQRIVPQAGTTTLTVKKLVVNNNGGEKGVADFPLFITKEQTITNVSSDVPTQVDAGTYAVSETNAPGYAQSFGGDCDAEGNVTLADGDNKRCIITNIFTPIPTENNPPTISFLQGSPDGLFENDGAKDKKGVADKTLFDFDLIYTDQDNDAPSSVKLVVEKVNQGGYEGYLNLEMSPLCPLCNDYTSGQIYFVVYGDLVKSLTFPKGDYRYRFETSDGVSSVQTPFVEFTVGYSNVLFLPGIEASRLYEPDGTPEGKQLWLSGETHNLELDTNGLSLAHSDIYTRDLIESAFGIDFYSSFKSSMDSLTNDGVIHDWAAVPYDWRLQLEQILTSGNEMNGNIFYLQETTTPYIIQELRRLAANSDTGKVNIVAHSNGGLVTKKLTSLLGPEEASRLIDIIVFVAVPQVGTPAAIAGLLHGYDQDIGLGLLLTRAGARQLGQNMPMVYNLLPSGGYFVSEGETVVRTPVITFAASLPDWITRYNGSSIDSLTGLLDFLSDTNIADCHSDFSSPCRVSPSDSFTNFPATINTDLLQESSSLVHALSLDIWQPPSGVEFVTVAGWGQKTLAQIEYKKVRGPRGAEEFTFTPHKVIDGDGTVVIPSALYEGVGVSSTRYWVDLARYPNGSYNHGRIFATKPVQDLIGSIITKSTGPLPSYVSTSEPVGPPIDRLDFTLHSPLTLGFSDSDGKYSGSTQDGIALEVPGVDYERYGDVQWLSVPKGLAGKLVMQGTGSGFFSLDINETSGNTEIASTSFEGIPSGTSTVATMNISPILSPTASSTLIIDFDGDEVPDTILQAKENAIVLFDSIAPTTFANVSGTLWKNGVYVGTTTVTLTAEDNPGGVGVEKTEYSFDGGQSWSLYASPLLTPTEGTTTIMYHSTDFFGNEEVPKSLSLHIVSVKLFLEDALTKLKSIHTGNDDIDNKTANIITELTKDIANKSWLDRNHLLWPKGLLVLVNEAGLVKSLDDLLNKARQKKNNIPIATQALYRDAQAKIVQSTALLATLSFDKAKMVKGKNATAQKTINKLVTRIQKMQDRAVANESTNLSRAQQLYGAVWFASEALSQASSAVPIRASDLGGLYDPETMKDLID